MKKFIVLVLIVVIAIVSIVVFNIFNSSSKKLSTEEKEAALTNILGRKPNLNEKEAAKGNLQYKGKYVTLMYPARAKIYVLKVNGEEKKDNWNLDSLNFDLDDPHITVLVTVSNAPSSVTSITDYPSVKLRQTQPGMYQQKDITTDGKSGLLFGKQDNTGFEKTAFFYLNNKIYMFSFLGSDLMAINDIFKNIMATVKFL